MKLFFGSVWSFDLLIELVFTLLGDFEVFFGVVLPFECSLLKWAPNLFLNWVFKYFSILS